MIKNHRWGCAGKVAGYCLWIAAATVMLDFMLGRSMEARHAALKKGLDNLVNKGPALSRADVIAEMGQPIEVTPDRMIFRAHRIESSAAVRLPLINVLVEACVDHLDTDEFYFKEERPGRFFYAGGCDSSGLFARNPLKAKETHD